MKKYFFLLFLVLFSINSTLFAQSRGVKIGYIDMEYILEKVSSYAEANNQLEQKAEKWKQEMETKKAAITKLEEALKTEKVLLTKELIAEREDEIAFQKNELLDYQQKKFGANGDLVVQKAVLVKPIQDQVFNAVQDIAEAKKFDFIFDKSSDLTMLFAAKRYDISDRVIQVITRGERKEQLTKKQQKEELEKDKKQDYIDEHPEMTEKQRLQEERKAARLQLIEDNKKAIEDKKVAAEAKRKQMLEDAKNKKNGTVSDKSTNGGTSNNTNPDKTTTDNAKAIIDQKKADADAAHKKTLEERQKVIEDRKKASEERRLKTIKTRDSIKAAKDLQLKNKQKP